MNAVMNTMRWMCHHGLTHRTHVNRGRASLKGLLFWMDIRNWFVLSKESVSWFISEDLVKDWDFG